MATVTDNLSELLDLIDRIQIVDTAEEEQALIDGVIAATRPTVLSFVNQHAFNLAASDTAFRIALMGSDFLLRDGVGMQVCLTMLDRPSGLNLNGTDLIPRILQAARGRSFAVFGTKDPWLAQAVAKLRDQGLTLVAVLDGFQTPQTYLDAVRTAAPDVILLAMGMPRQELLAAQLRDQTDRPSLIINGGAILDFLGERFERAPLIIRRLRLEWLFRLCQEPSRLAKRYLAGGVVFLWTVIRLRRPSAARRRGADRP